MPFGRHEEQPQAAQGSRKQPEQDTNPFDQNLTTASATIGACTLKLELAFRACANTVTRSPRLADSEGGKKLLSIIERRISWLKQDAESDPQRIMSSLAEADRWHAQVTLQDSVLSKRTRKEEDRLRQTRTDLIEPVADRRRRLDDRPEGSSKTYEEKIRGRLGDAYDAFRKAVAEYERPIKESIEREKARQRRQLEVWKRGK